MATAHRLAECTSYFINLYGGPSTMRTLSGAAHFKENKARMQIAEHKTSAQPRMQFNALSKNFFRHSS